MTEMEQATASRRSRERNPQQRLDDRIPPHSLEAEMTVLGCALISRDAAELAATIVAPSDFYAHTHETLAKIVFELVAAGSPVDKISVVEALRRRELLAYVGGAAYLSSLMDVTPTTANVAYHAALVAEKAKLRRIADAARRIVDLAYDGESDVDAAAAESERLLCAALEAGKRIVDERPFPALLTAVYKGAADAHEAQREGRATTMLTPWDRVNEMTGGFMPGEFNVWAAGPQMGKSGAISMLADYVAAHYGDVAMFALEMGAEETARRLVAMYAQVSSRRMRIGRVRDDEWVTLTDANSTLSTRRLHIFGKECSSLAAIRRELRRLHREGDLKAAIVDHAGWISDSSLTTRRNVSKHEALEAIYMELARLADEMRFACHVVYHVNREGMKGEPTIAHIRDGGNIEGLAHAVIFPYRANPLDAERRHEGKFIVGKCRSGEEGYVPMHYDGARHLWRELVADDVPSLPWWERQRVRAGQQQQLLSGEAS